MSDIETLKMQTVAGRLAGHLADKHLASLPEDAVEAAKRVMLDTLAVAWAATDLPGSKPLRDLAMREGGAADATLIGYGGRVPAGMAALVNGTYAAALDYDCLHEPSVMHCDAVILPAVLAMAEREGSSGADFLCALTLGNDVACRLGLSARDNPPGWFVSSVYGALAAAAACAKLLRLDARGIRNAMGIAYSNAAGTRQAIIERSYTKRMQTAFAAQTGLQAALLAQAGINGPAAVLEGQSGVWKLYAPGNEALVFDGLGESYANAEISLKKYPSCAANHCAIEGTSRIVHGNGLKPDDIAHARITVTPYIEGITGTPFRPGAEPQVDAQFNLFYSVASVLLRGHLDVSDIQPPAVLDPAVMPMVERVEMRVDRSLNGKLAPVTVEIATRDGRNFREHVPHLPGAPEAPLSRAEVEAKFRSCAALGVDPLDAQRAQRLIERVDAVETLPDMRRFFDGIVRVAA
ncbi:MAG: MmgE/PrpD family protein [Reyranellaceae bacterium]